MGREFFRPQSCDFTATTFKFRTSESSVLPMHEDIKRALKVPRIPFGTWSPICKPTSIHRLWFFSDLIILSR